MCHLMTCPPYIIIVWEARLTNNNPFFLAFCCLQSIRSGLVQRITSGSLTEAISSTFSLPCTWINHASTQIHTNRHQPTHVRARISRQHPFIHTHTYIHTHNPNGMAGKCYSQWGKVTNSDPNYWYWTIRASGKSDSYDRHVSNIEMLLVLFMCLVNEKHSGGAGGAGANRATHKETDGRTDGRIYRQTERLVCTRIPLYLAI